MNWHHFQTYNDAPTHAFESMCNQLFDLWCRKEFENDLISVIVVNGSGGDGGVESLSRMKNGTHFAMQAKWFLNSIDSHQFGQIKASVHTALKLRPNIQKYIVCVPRDLSALKIGRDKQPVKNDERTRWDALKVELQSEYSSIELILWDESQLQILLQEQNSAGIYRHWFEKAEISEDIINYSFDKQKAGWLSQRYIPELHTCGIIKEKIQSLLGTEELRKGLLRELQNVESLCENLRQECFAYKNFDKRLLNNTEFANAIENALQAVAELSGQVSDVKKLLHEDAITMSALDKCKWYVSFDQLITLLKKEQYIPKERAHRDDLLKAAESLQEYDITTLLHGIDKTDQKFLLVLGEAGTGKTHGIANQAEDLLTNRHHLAILLRAKDYSPEHGWHNILLQALGLSNQWNEFEVWNALEALSNRYEINMTHEKGQSLLVKPKILICIDGVDESLPYSPWIERFREAALICNQHNRIRFCITCRPYVFSELPYKDELFNNKVTLPVDGDASVDKLYPLYIQHYQIDDKGCPWIRWSLKTPFSLRLFCELHKNKHIHGIQRPSITITRLMEALINQIEVEFKEAYTIHWSKNDFIVRRVLIELSKRFLLNTELSREELIESIKSLPVLVNIQNDQYHYLLDYFENYGIIYSRSYRPASLFELPCVKYSVGIQPFFDYFIALYAVESMNSPECFKLSSGIKRHEGALQMAGIILLEDYDYLISENKDVQCSLSSESLFDLVSFALSNVSAEASGRYRSTVRQMMHSNPQHLRRTVNQIIIPVARIDGHPLGATLLHEYLLSFNKVSKRDLMWSLPSTLYADPPWRMTEPYILLEDERCKLTEDDSYLGLPLIYVWILTTVDNRARNSCRKELMKWALIKPDEYWKLFEKAIITNDPQMKEDLLSIAMGVVFTAKRDDTYLIKFRDWVANNVFEPSRISDNYDAAIRYYSHAIMERLNSLGLLNSGYIFQCRPPYITNKFMPLSKEALSGTRMGGYGPIDYDLARYVLCDYIDGMFFSERIWDKSEVEDDVDYSDYYTRDEIENMLLDDTLPIAMECKEALEDALKIHIDREEGWKLFELRFVQKNANNNSYTNSNDDEDAYASREQRKMSTEAEKVLEEYAERYQLESIHYEQLLIALTYQYLLELGWNEDDFEGSPNGGKPGEILGADIAILRKYHPATHGSMSSVMTFAEKYTWCARNEILGYLADRLPFDDEGRLSFLEDYSLLDDFPNPAQELFEDIEDNVSNENDVWFLPEELAYVPRNTSDANFLKRWIYEAPIPEFQKWLLPDLSSHPFLENGWIPLYGYNTVNNSINGETLLWISSGIIETKNFSLLLKDVNNGRENLIEGIDNPIDFHTSTQAHCYITPKEICWMNWKKEYEPFAKYISLVNGGFVTYCVHKNIAECTGNYVDKGDVSYRIPSKKIREYLGICDGNGHVYTNIQNETVAQCIDIGEGWENSQSYLFVNGGKLMTALNKDQMKLFWLVRLQRQATPKGMEAHPDTTEQYDRCWLAWEEDGKIKTIKYLDEVH